MAQGWGRTVKRRGELRMIQRAVVQGWKVPEPERSRAVDLVAETLADPTSTERERLAACRLAVLMERANQSDRQTGRR